MIQPLCRVGWTRDSFSDSSDKVACGGFRRVWMVWTPKMTFKRSGTRKIHYPLANPPLSLLAQQFLAACLTLLLNHTQQPVSTEEITRDQEKYREGVKRTGWGWDV